MSEGERGTRRLLFVCSRNLLRSPKAEAICQGIHGIEATSAGTNNDAAQPLTGDLIEWADVILSMGRAHRKRIQQKFGRLLKGKELAVLGVPDEYQDMQPELIDLFRVRLRRWIG